jgi:alkanesulfonate monooxygenase SsuD/methylene tetrahydromethanopterin reductase-like flavin-dependent oxidoreductase (luciferase family)
MRCNVMLEPQEGLTYAQILAVAQRADALRFEGLYRSDHYTTVSAGDQVDSTDAWATLAGLARETERIKLGTLVSPATFRTFGNLVKVVATVAEMAGSGRVDVGLGTGWLEEEHRQLGFPFEDLRTRFARLAEQLDALRALLDAGGDPITRDGTFVQLRGARLMPTPTPPPRLICGGKGMHRTPALAARYADELNGVYLTAAEAAMQRRALDAACEAVSRDPATVTYSIMTGCAVGATAADVDARIARLHERSRFPGSVAAYRERIGPAWVLGTPSQAAERLGALAAAGAQRVMLQLLDPDDLEMLDVLAEEVLPLVG